MISVILFEPETPGNIGAVARAMKNFELNDLILINPKCDPHNIEARKRAKHANDLLKKAKIRKTNAILKKFDYLVATSAILGTDYNIPRTPFSVDKFAEIIQPIEKKGSKIGIMIGREGIGLTNEEIKMADFLVTIPASRTYPVLNISHSAAILFYELNKQKGKKFIDNKYKSIGKKEKSALLKLINSILKKMPFQTKENLDNQKVLWKRIVGKSFLTSREAAGLFGFFKKLK